MTFSGFSLEELNNLLLCLLVWHSIGVNFWLFQGLLPGKLNNLLSWSEFLTNCGIYLSTWDTDLQLLNRSSHCKQIYKFSTDLLLNRSSSWITDLTNLQGFSGHFTSLDQGFCLMNWSYFPFTSHCWHFEAFITQIQWILLLFFNTWKKERNPGLNKALLPKAAKPSQATVT